MKHSVKKTGLLILAAVLLCTAAAAAGCIAQEELHAPAEMVGTWYAEDNDNIYYIITKGDNAGSTFIITGIEEDAGEDNAEPGWELYNFRWSVNDNNQLVITTEENNTFSGTWAADKQTVTLDGGLVMYKISDIKTETVDGKTVIQKQDPVVGIWKGVGVIQVLQFSSDNKGIYSDEKSKKFTWERTDRVYKLTFEDGTTAEAHHNSDETLTCMKTTYVKMSDI